MGRCILTRALLPLSCIIACKGSISAQANPAAAVQATAVAWYINSQLGSSAQQVAIVCLSLGTPRNAKAMVGPMNTGPDVPDAVLTAVDKSVIPLRSGSECTTDAGRGLRTVERESRRQAVSVLVGPPTFETPERASVALDFRFDARNGGGWSCWAVRDKGRWVIDECKATWIS